MRMWSPARRKVKSAVEIAAMPLEATMAASVFSNAAMCADSTWNQQLFGEGDGLAGSAYGERCSKQSTTLWLGPLLQRVYRTFS